jgi:hypothetical protein
MFTPGPWHAVNDGTDDEPMMSVKAARIAGRPPRHEVAIVATGDSPQEMETANAYLIAAAPDLYAALVALVAKEESFGWASSLLDKANAALRKARGELPSPANSLP